MPTGIDFLRKCTTNELEELLAMFTQTDPDPIVNIFGNLATDSEIELVKDELNQRGVIGVKCALCNETTIIINRRAYDPDRAEFCHACMQLPESEVEAILGE